MPSTLTKPHYGVRPVPGLPVQVQCKGFKCMAFLDKDGKWVDLFTRKYLSDVLGVVPTLDCLSGSLAYTENT